MRILDTDTDKTLNNILLMLTPAEAKELRDSLDDILATPKNKHRHEHIDNIEYTKELTVEIYYSDDVSGYAQRIQQLIREDR